jgi:hypothetical protein
LLEGGFALRLELAESGDILFHAAYLRPAYLPVRPAYLQDACKEDTV